MRRSLFLPLTAVVGLLAAGCVTPPPPDPGPQQCHPGTFSATGEAPCTPAPAGSYVDTVGATEAVDCLAGTYQDEEGQTSCKNAAPGSYVDFDGAAASTFCPLGTYQPSLGATECLLAPVGSYVSSSGAVAPTICPPGTTTQAEGSTSASDCGEFVLAVAYSNLDGTDGYDPDSTDVLIAKLVDTNLDEEVSIGDTVVTDRYPLDFGATGFGDFQSTTHAVAAISELTGSTVRVVDSAGSYFYFQRNLIWDYYQEQGSTGGLLIRDIWTSASTEYLNVGVGAPSSPDTAANETRSPSNGLNDPFIDVDLFFVAV